MESQRKDNGAKGKQRKRKKDEHRSDAQAVHGQDIGGESDAKRGADKKKKGKEGKEVTSSTPPTLPKAQKESEEARDESKSTEENSDDPIVIAFVNGIAFITPYAETRKHICTLLIHLLAHLSHPSTHERYY